MAIKVPNWIQHPNRPEYIMDADTGKLVFKAENLKDSLMLARILAYLKEVENPPKSEAEYWKRMGGRVCQCLDPNWGTNHNR